MEGWGLVRNADKEEVMGSESKNGKVPLISKIAYGFGDVGCNFSWMFVSNFLMIFIPMCLESVWQRYQP